MSFFLIFFTEPELRTVQLELRGDNYLEVGNFSNEDLLQSPGFGDLKLKVSEVFEQT